MNSIPINVFWPRTYLQGWKGNRLQGMGVKLSPSYIFLDRELPFIDLKLAHILSNWKTLKEAVKSFWLWRDIFGWSHHIPAALTGNFAFPCFCWIVNFSSFFSVLFGFFCEFQCHFYNNRFNLTFIMGIFYFILVWKVKIHNIFSVLLPANLQYKIIGSCNYD